MVLGRGHLQYDAYGRRIQNLLGLSFLYDGVNPTQELSGSSVTANLLSGGVDEVFSRTDSLGAFTPLKDALGHTIALVDGGGNVVTQYTYDPFGNTTVSGASNANEFQYTGRENEGSGLYFYRARYYSVVLHRFVSEDPLQFAGSGTNFYAYAFDNPINLSDPSGMMPAWLAPIADELLELGFTQADVDAAIAWLEANSASEAICASTAVCGLIVLDAGLAVWDGVQLLRLCQAWGSCYPTPLPKTNPGENPVPVDLLPYPQPEPQPSPTTSLAGRSCKKRGDPDECTERSGREVTWCTQSFKSWSPELWRLCIARAKKRLEACLDNLPDPGPLNPLDPDWSID